MLLEMRMLNLESRLLLAMQHQDVHEVRCIISEPKFDPDILFRIPVGTEVPALCMALKRRLPLVAQLLIEAGASVNRTDSFGCAPMHHAVLSELKETIILLAKARADVNARCSSGHTPLHLACQNNKHQLVSTLLKLGADPNLRCLNGLDALGLACNHLHPDVVRVLLEQGDANVNASYTGGDNPLMLSLNVGLGPGAFSKRIVELLLDWGADPNIPNKHSYAPVHAALDRCSDHDLTGVQTLELLLEHGARCDVLTGDGKNALSIAATRRLDSVCRRLLIAGQLPYDDSPAQQQALLITVAHLAIYGRLDLLRLLFEANYSPKLRRWFGSVGSLMPHNVDERCWKYLCRQMELANNPLSLQETVRLQIRRQLGKRLDQLLEKLPLPVSLTTFLRLDGL